MTQVCLEPGTHWHRRLVLARTLIARIEHGREPDYDMRRHYAEAARRALDEVWQEGMSAKAWRRAAKEWLREGGWLVEREQVEMLEAA